MELKEKDFCELEFDLYANGKLVQTTSEAKGKKENLQIKEYKPQVIMLGQAFIMKALDEDIIKNENPQKEKTLELTSKEAYGPRKKELLKVFPKSAFDEQQMRPVVGVVYDFNGTYGTVKSVNGGRIMVDFNNPLAGKDIKVVYKVNKKVEDIKEKIAVVFDALLRIPQNMFKVETKEKDVTLKLPAQLIVLKDHIIKTLEDYITEAKDYKIKIEALDEKQN